MIWDLTKIAIVAFICVYGWSTLTLYFVSLSPVDLLLYQEDQKREKSKNTCSKTFWDPHNWTPRYEDGKYLYDICSYCGNINKRSAK